MGLLAEEVLLSKSGVTRLIDRLVRMAWSSGAPAWQTPAAPRRS